MAATKRTSFQIERDRREITDLYCQGWTQFAIVDRLNDDVDRNYQLSRQMISYDLRQIQKKWLASALVDFDHIKAQEITKIDRLEREYWKAWEKSQEDEETVTQEGTLTTVEKIRKTRRGQVGDPRFLAGVQWCIERRCKIIGIDAPTKIDVNWQEEARRDGVDPVSIFEKMVAEAAARMEAEDSIDTDADTN